MLWIYVADTKRCWRWKWAKKSIVCILDVVVVVVILPLLRFRGFWHVALEMNVRWVAFCLRDLFDRWETIILEAIVSAGRFFVPEMMMMMVMIIMTVWWRSCAMDSTTAAAAAGCCYMGLQRSEPLFGLSGFLISSNKCFVCCFRMMGTKVCVWCN